MLKVRIYVNTKMSEISNKRIFDLRSGEQAEHYLDVLSASPETPLSDDEKQLVLDFENALIDGQYHGIDGVDIRTNETRGLEQVFGESKYLAARHEITSDYLCTPAGRESMQQLGMNPPEFVSVEQATEFIQGVAGFTDRNVLKALAKQSREWATKRITEEIQNLELSRDFSRVMVFDDTAKMRNTLQALGDYREFYLKVRKDLKHSGIDDLVGRTKRDISSLYLKIVNGKLAEIYPDALWAWDQARAAGSETEQRDLREAWPAGESLSGTNPLIRHHFIEALDHLRNGTSYKNGLATSINHELRELFQDAQDNTEIHHPGRFNSEEYRRLGGVYLDAAGMQAFCKDILDELGLLSTESEDTYRPDRGERAADGKWQVVVRSEVSAMGAEDPEGVLEIPADFRRSITKPTAPVGVVPGAAHEIAHIYQLNNARNNGGSLRVASKIRGRSSLVLRESGSIWAESLVQSELFGVNRPYSPHYMRAMEVLESGGGEKLAIKAFSDSYRAANPSESFEDSVKIAESRVMRLCRRYGGYNSQPLNYAQTASFVERADRLSDEQAAMVFSEGSFDLPDMVMLHKYGLLNSNAECFPVDKFCDIVERKLRKLLGE